MRAQVDRSPHATLDAVRIGGQGAAGAGDWQHVASYLALQDRWRELAQRWNALAPELGLEAVAADDPGGGVAACSQYVLYKRVKALAAEADSVDQEPRKRRALEPRRRSR